MKLQMVTITGADDGTDIKALLDLTERYPFVEWGLLRGSSDGGSPRWPTDEWINLLVANAGARECPLNLSLHLCGGALRAFLRKGVLPEVQSVFQRMQLNFHGAEAQSYGLLGHRVLGRDCEKWNRPVIVQADGVNDFLAYLLSGWFAGRRSEGVKSNAAAHALFDRSHGAGVVPGTWGVPDVGFRSELYCGYAGGLGPDNIALELPRIAEAAAGEPFWIDMETRVRTPDDAELDLHKVAAVLEYCAQFVEGPTVDAVPAVAA